MSAETSTVSEINGPQTTSDLDQSDVNEAGSTAEPNPAVPDPEPPKAKESKGKKKVAKTAKTEKTAKPAKSAKTEKPAKSTSKTTAARPAAKTVTAETMSKARYAANAFHMLGDPTRLSIIMLLKEDEINVGSLCAKIDQSQPATSHHLALLRHSGMIEGNRNGKHIFYSLTEKGEKMAEIIDNIE